MAVRRSLVLVGILAAPSLVACAAGGAESSPDPSASQTATAVVEVERTSSDFTHNDAVAARVVRVKQGVVDDAALRIAGVGDDIPLPGGPCFVPADAPVAIQGRNVELLDIGQVTMANDEGAKATVLGPRVMPDPAGVVSGYFYSARSADAFAPGSRLALRASGGADLADGFNVNVSAPRELEGVRAAFATDGSLDVAWDASDADPKDVVVADVLAPAPHVALRCTATDSGHLVVSGGALASIDSGSLGVHRLHKESFKAKGIEPGEVRFDVAKVITFTR